MRAIPIVLFLLLLAGDARGELVDALAGSWRGSLQIEGAEAGAELPVNARLEATRQGFEIAITAPGAKPLDATMVPGPAPDVFEVETGGGLFGFLADGNDRSVLDGRPLLWARRTAESLVVYRLHIVEDGGFELLHIVLTPAADRLEVHVERRLDGVSEPGLHGFLDRRS